MPRSHQEQFTTLTGKIEMFKANEDAVVAKHRKLGRQVIDNGLIIDEVIVFDSWAEIFASDLPAGEDMLEADKVLSRQRQGQRQEERERGR